MSDIQGRAMTAAAGARQEGEMVAGSSAVSAAFADVTQQADQGAVRWLFGARSSEGARGGTAATGGPPAASSAPPTAYAEVSQAAEQASVRQLMRAGGASPEPELSGTGFAYPLTERRADGGQRYLT